jgi:phosphomannomutase
VLPGFKYIAQKILQYEQMPHGPQFVFGCEESYGYLYGTHARDKDAVICSCLLAEIAWNLKKQGKTLIDALYELWEVYGYFEESLMTCSFGETKVGHDRMNQAMKSLRISPPSAFADFPCIAVEDLLLKEFHGEPQYQVGKDFPKSDAFIFTLEDLSQVIIRPSGTEPKIKIYFQLTPSVGTSIAQIMQNTTLKTEKLKAFTSKLLT